MNKWTTLSLVVLVAILSISLWLITKAQDPLLEAESAAEQEIGVEEFEGSAPENADVMTDEEIIIEPDMAMDESADDSTQETLPSDGASPDPSATETAQPETAQPETKEQEKSEEPTDN
jgi:hypothetical protein